MSGRIFEIPKEHVDNAYNKYSRTSSQLAVCQEELGELVQAVSKYIRCADGEPGLEYIGCRSSIVEELTHVAIILGMLSKMFAISIDEIEAEVRRKAEESNFDMTNYHWYRTHRGVYDIPKYVKDDNGNVILNPEWCIRNEDDE